MHERRVKAALKRERDTTATQRPGPTHRAQLESSLLDTYRRRYPRHRRWLMLLNPWNRVARLAMVGLAVALLGVGACSTSTTTEVEMGQKLTITMGGLSGDKADADLQALEGELNRFFAAQPDVEGVTFNLRGMNGETAFDIMAWGQGLDAAALAADLRKQVPRLEGTTVDVSPLNGSVRENILSHLGHEYLGLELEVSGETADEIRAQILAQMAAQGLGGDAQVQVENLPDGRRTIKVEVTKEAP